MSTLIRKTLSLIAPLGLVSLTLAAGVVLAPQDRQLKDNDLKGLGKNLADYIEAAKENKKVTEAEQDVRDALEKLGKKLKGTDPLSLPADLGQALWLAKDYGKTRPKKGKVSEEVYESNFFGEDGLEYAVWSPSKYSARDGSYAMILTIPDHGDKPKDHITEDWISPDVRDGAIIAAPSMPEDLKMWNEPGTAGAPGGIAYVMTTLRAVREAYAIDFDRVYLAGRGAGVETVVAIGNSYPDLFAGVIGRAGDAGDTSPSNFRNLPTYFAGSGSKATAFDEAIKAAGYANCTIDPEGKESDVWNWIQGHKRDSYPDKVTLVPGAPFPNKAYWIQVPPSDGKTTQKIEGSIDRETNTITIDAEGLSRVTVFFNDALVNMDEPIKVICNGAEHLDLVPRSFNVTLDLIFRGSSDPGKLYVAYKGYEIPIKAMAGSEKGE